MLTVFKRNCNYCNKLISYTEFINQQAPLIRGNILYSQMSTSSSLSTATKSISSTILQTTVRAPTGTIESSNDKLVEPQIISKTEGLVCMHVQKCICLLPLKKFKF